MTFGGKVALVTGGASGMGRETALRMARRGARVAILDVNQKALAETAAESGNIAPYACDVSDLGQVRSVVAEVEKALGPIDRLVHCAAIMPGQALRDMSAEAIFKVMAINYGGTVNMTKTLLPLMEARGHGEIILYGSMAGDVLTHNLGAYCATKAATNAFAEVLVHENRNSPVRILLVCPPMVDTPLLEQAMEAGPESLKASRRTGSNMASPSRVIEAAEAAIERGRWVVRPCGAALMVRFRRFFPGLLWKVMEKANAPKAGAA